MSGSGKRAGANSVRSSRASNRAGHDAPRGRITIFRRKLNPDIAETVGSEICAEVSAPGRGACRTLASLVWRALKPVRDEILPPCKSNAPSADLAASTPRSSRRSCGGDTAGSARLLEAIRPPEPSPGDVNHLDSEYTSLRLDERRGGIWW